MVPCSRLIRAAAMWAGSSLLLWGVATPTQGQAWYDQRDLQVFRVHADYSTHELQPLLTEIARLSDEIRDQLRLDVPNQRIADIYLFAERSTYQKYLKRFFPDIPKRRAMFVKSHSPGNVFAYASKELPTDLRHEYTHAVLHAALPYVPLWLDEGLAEYFEVPAQQRVDRHPHLAATRRTIRWRRPLGLAELEQLTNLHDMQGRQYRDAWAWVHFMLHGPAEGRDILQQYLAHVAAHRLPAPLSEHLSAAIPDAEQRLRQHFLRGTFAASPSTTGQ